MYISFGKNKEKQKEQRKSDWNLAQNSHSKKNFKEPEIRDAKYLRDTCVK